MQEKIPVRRAVAILTSHSGATESLASAVAALERAGQPVLRVSVEGPRLTVPIAFSFVRQLLRRPADILRIAATLLLRGGRHRLAAIVRLPLAVQLADSLSAKGITHLHAADALASVLAWAAVQPGSLTFSASISSSPGRAMLRRIVAAASFVRVSDPATLDRVATMASARRKGVALLPFEASSSAAFLRLLEEHAHNAAPTDAPMLQVDWRLLGAERIGLRWMTTRFDAGVAEVTIDDGTTQRTAIVKHHRRVPPFESTAAGRAANETTTLRRLRSLMPGPHSVPELLLFDESSLTLVMEQAPGVALDRLFGEAAAHRETLPALLAAIGQAGQWLQSMQAATYRDMDARPLAGESIRAATTDLVAVAEKDRTIRGHAAGIRRELDTLGAAVLSGMQNGITGHHGDFWPGNIFIDSPSRRVTVIDLEGYREGVALEDAAYFLLRTELLARRYRLPVALLQEAFHTGYGPGRDDPALRLFTLTKALQTLKHTFQGNLGSPQRIWTVSVLRRTILCASRL